MVSGGSCVFNFRWRMPYYLSKAPTRNREHMKQTRTRARVDPDEFCTTISASLPESLDARIRELAEDYFGGNVSACMRRIIDAGLDEVVRSVRL